MSGQLSDQIHDRFAVLLHLGAALLDGALNSGPGRMKTPMSSLSFSLFWVTTRRRRVRLALRRQTVQRFHPLWIKVS